MPAEALAWHWLLRWTSWKGCDGCNPGPPQVGCVSMPGLGRLRPQYRPGLLCRCLLTARAPKWWVQHALPHFISRQAQQECCSRQANTALPAGRLSRMPSAHSPTGVLQHVLCTMAYLSRVSEPICLFEALLLCLLCCTCVTLKMGVCLYVRARVHTASHQYIDVHQPYLHHFW